MEDKGYYINGIQQIGLGVNDIYSAWQWYIDHFHFDLPVFDEEAVAELMLPYTEGQPRKRQAALVLNYQGGGGLEIWRHKSIESRPPKQKVQIGDLGICALKIKCKSAYQTHTRLKKSGVDLLTDVHKSPDGRDHFYAADLNGNLINVETANDWHADKGWLTGGICGCVVGVSDVDRSAPFYKEILGYDVEIARSAGAFEDINAIEGSQYTFDRMILGRSQPGKGGFANLLGDSRIELVAVKGRPVQKIFEGRMWGELGFIHLCFDVEKMEVLKSFCAQKGAPFTVDSGNSFDMGEAAGRFAYTEDPDGTLIEFVETHKIPVLKKLGWYYNLKNRPVQTPLSPWLIKAMSWMRVKKARPK